ncbi:hypothetical protein HYX18_02275 [Candidatus Woesearchaeota archaeon]|nr:hypothetical protein [Candidatus Woesearchaeota archaeon]
MSKTKCKNCKRYVYELKVCGFCRFHACQYCNPKNKCKKCGYKIVKVLKYQN